MLTLLRGRTAAWREAGALVARHRGTLALGLLLLLVSRLAGLVIPLSSKYVVDTVIAARRLDVLYWLVAAGAAATLIQAGTGLALARLVGINALRAISGVQRGLHGHVLRLPVRYFDSTKAGILVSRVMNDPEGLQNLLGSGILQLVGSGITALAALAVLFYLHWPLTLLTLALLLLFSRAMGGSFSRLRPIYRARAALTAEVTGRLTEAFGGIRVVKTYGAERREERVFTASIHRLLRRNVEVTKVNAKMTALSALAVGGVGVTIMLLGGRAAVSGAMTVGDVVMYAVFVNVLTSPLVQIAAVGARLSEAFAGLDRIREIRQVATEEAADGEREPRSTAPPAIGLERVCFAYVPGRPVLRDVSVRVAAGSTTALVGPSGAGKSTLIMLVMGFERPASGRIVVGGQDLAVVRAADHRRQLGVVLQETFLFDGTIRENIAYAKPRASAEEIRRASRVAHCDEFVVRLEHGLDTVVGERGLKLSGGQRQRISIARAILADPRILILDEATSSVDAESEALIQDGLRSLRAGRTTLVIAHRLSTILSADQILVLDQGEIVGSGTHAELVRGCALYRQLYERQALVQEDRFVNPGEERPVAAARSAAAAPRWS